MSPEAIPKQMVPNIAASNVLEGGVRLRTCERIESYVFSDSPEEAHRALLGDLWSKSGIVIGAESCVERLASIASGAMSRLVGEAYIRDQVTRAFNKVPDSLPLSWLRDAALEIGATARQAAGWPTGYEYPDLVLRSLRQLSALPLGEVGLCIRGGGFLGTAVAREAVVHDFRAVVIMSSAKKKKLRTQIPRNVAIARPTASVELFREPFLAVVATNGQDESCRQLVNYWLSLESCYGVLDLCGVPVATELAAHPKYETLYSGLVSELMERHRVQHLPSRVEVMDHARSLAQSIVDPIVINRVSGI